MAAELGTPDQHVFTVTMEFGFHLHRDPAHTYHGPSDPHQPECGAFLHPIIRHRHRGLVSEFHLGDSLLGRWDLPHDTGGAVTSYDTQFDQWGRRLLGLSTEHLPPPSYPDFRPWTEAEIAAWQAEHPPAREESMCANNLSTSLENRHR